MRNTGGPQGNFRKQVNGPADAVLSYRPTMAEHPGSNIGVEQLVSVLTKAVIMDGHVRRYIWLSIWPCKTQLTKHPAPCSTCPQRR